MIVSGASGLVGSALVPALQKAGHRVLRLVRSPAASGSDELSWDPAEGRLDAAKLEGAQAAVHLAGESIAAGRWSAARKALILQSRVRGTALLAGALAGLKNPPKVLVCASATGFYGDRGAELLSEQSPCGEGFLPEVCREWEKAAQGAAQKGIRVVHLRFGMVLSPQGGALAKMLPPFKLGVGGMVGSGKQYYSWISIDDAVGAILQALASEGLSGPVNAVSPVPATNLEFTKTLGKVLGRPTIFPLPAFAARLAFGELADALLLASTRVDPAKLKAAGFTFKHPALEPALKELLGA